MLNNKDLVEIMSQILELHKDWSSRMLALEEERVRLERLRLEGVTSVSNEVPMGQLRVSEEQQDADWAFRNNLISPAEYSDLLEKAGLSSTDIEFI